MADQSACQDWYFCPARNDFNFGNKKKSHGARSGENGGVCVCVCGGGGRGLRQNSYFFFRQNAVTIVEV